MRIRHQRGQAGRCGTKILTRLLTKHLIEGYCALESVQGHFLAFAGADLF